MNQLKVNVNEKKKNGMTAFHYGCLKGRLVCLMYLLKKGAIPFYKTYSGFNALHLASKSGNLDLVKYLVEDLFFSSSLKSFESGVSSLHIACKCGKINIVKYFVEEKGVDPNEKNKN